MKKKDMQSVGLELTSLFVSREELGYSYELFYIAALKIRDWCIR